MNVSHDAPDIIHATYRAKPYSCERETELVFPLGARAKVLAGRYIIMAEGVWIDDSRPGLPTQRTSDNEWRFAPGMSREGLSG